MYWHKKKDMRAGGLWRCREARKPLDAARWPDYYRDRMPSGVRIPRALDNRRRKAIGRRRERQLRREHGSL
jgi:hypothetical protein